MTFPEEHGREDALIRLSRAALELCPEQRLLQLDLLHQLCLQLWGDVIDSLVSYSLWLRVLLSLPEKETIYVFIPEEQGQGPGSQSFVSAFPVLCPDSRGTLAICYPTVESVKPQHTSVCCWDSGS